MKRREPNYKELGFELSDLEKMILQKLARGRWQHTIIEEILWGGCYNPLAYLQGKAKNFSTKYSHSLDALLSRIEDHGFKLIIFSNGSFLITGISDPYLFMLATRGKSKHYTPDGIKLDSKKKSIRHKRAQYFNLTGT